MALTRTDIKTIRETALKGLVGATVGLGTIGAVGLAREALRHRELRRHELGKEEHFINMLKKNPELAKHDPAKVREIFETIADVAPSMAKHPHIAGSFVSSSLDYGSPSGVPFSQVMDLIKAQKSHEETTHGHLGTNVASAFVAGNLMGLK